MKKLALLVLLIVGIGGMVRILLGNQQKIQEMAKIDRLAAYPVAVIPVKKQKIVNRLSQVGEIIAEHDVAVVAEAQGKVTAVMADVGSPVAAGVVLMTIDDELPKARFLAARSNYEKAQKDLERFTVLHREDIISDAQFETTRLAYQAAEAEYTAAKRQYADTAVTAPISGVITARSVNRGAMIAPGTVVANIVDVTQLKVRVNVTEGDAFRLKEGAAAMVETDVYPEIQFAGKIKNISAKGDEAHTFTVETQISPQKDYPLKAGMFGRVTFEEPNGGEAPVIPREALIDSIKSPQVYVVAKNVAQLRDIVVGPEIDSYLIVRRGLREGELVVVNGQDNLEDHAAVTIKE